MKTFKLTDLIISTVLILTSVFLALFIKEWDFIPGYFITVGLWQIISMVIHAIKGWFMTKGGSRSNYHWISFSVCISFPFIFYFSFIILVFFYLFFMLFILAAIMSFYYMLMCYEELKSLN